MWKSQDTTRFGLLGITKVVKASPHKHNQLSVKQKGGKQLPFGVAAMRRESLGESYWSFLDPLSNMGMICYLLYKSVQQGSRL